MYEKTVKRPFGEHHALMNPDVQPHTEKLNRQTCDGSETQREEK